MLPQQHHHNTPPASYNQLQHSQHIDSRHYPPASSSTAVSQSHIIHATYPSPSHNIAYSQPVSNNYSPYSQQQQHHQQQLTRSSYSQQHTNSLSHSRAVASPLPALAVPLQPTISTVTSSHPYYGSPISPPNRRVDEQVVQDRVARTVLSQSQALQQRAQQLPLSPTQHYKPQTLSLASGQLPLTFSDHNSQHSTSSPRRRPEAEYYASGPLSPVPIDTSGFDQLIDDFSTMLDGRTSTEWRSAFANKRSKWSAANANYSAAETNGTRTAYSASYTSSLASSPEPRAVLSQMSSYTTSQPSTSKHLQTNSNHQVQVRDSPPNNTGSNTALSDYDSPNAYKSRSPVSGHRTQPSRRSPQPIAKSGSLSDFWRESLHQRHSAHTEQMLPTPLATVQPAANPQTNTINGPTWRQQARQRTTSPVNFEYSSKTVPSSMTFGTAFPGTARNSALRYDESDVTYQASRPNFSELNALIDEVQRLTEEDIHDPLARRSDKQRQQVQKVTVAGTTITVPRNPAYMVEGSDEEFDNVPSGSRSVIRVETTRSQPVVSYSPTQSKQSEPTRPIVSMSATNHANHVRFEVANSQPLSSPVSVASTSVTRTNSSVTRSSAASQPSKGSLHSPNFYALDNAVTMAMTCDVGKKPKPLKLDDSADLIPHKVLDQPAMSALNRVGDLMRYSADVMQMNQSVKLAPPTAKSPTPSTSSMNDNLPSGLPSPRPKHHLREQLILAGVEPRSPTVRHGSNWTFAERAPNVSSGSVMARVQEMEKPPSPEPFRSPPMDYAVQVPQARNVSKITASLSSLPISTPIQTFSPIRPIQTTSPPLSPNYHQPMSVSPSLGGQQMQPVTSLKNLSMYEETVYRTKPVIHVNLSVIPQVHSQVGIYALCKRVTCSN